MRHTDAKTKRGLAAVGAVVVGLGAVASLTATNETAAASHAAKPAALVRDARAAGCSARDFILVGKQTDAPSGSALYSEAVYASQRIRNAGASCTFVVPNTIQVRNTRGLRRTIEVEGARAGLSYRIPHGETRKLVIGGSWSTPGPKGWHSAPCHDPITNVTRVAIPLRTGDLPLKLGTVWHEACTSPASTSIEITSVTGYPEPPEVGV